MKSTTEQIALTMQHRKVISLDNQLKSYIAEWKAILPATPEGVQVALRIDQAVAWLFIQPFDRQLDFLTIADEYKPTVQTPGNRNVRGAACAIRAIEAAMKEGR